MKMLKSTHSHQNLEAHRRLMAKMREVLTYYTSVVLFLNTKFHASLLSHCTQQHTVDSSSFIPVYIDDPVSIRLLVLESCFVEV